METGATYTFTDNDFVAPIKISGTVNLTGLGTVEDPFVSAKVELYRDSDFTELVESSNLVYTPSAAWNWEVTTLPFNQPTDLYVKLQVNFLSGSWSKKLADPVNIYNQDKAVPAAMGPFTVKSLTLGGTVDWSVFNSLGVAHDSAKVYILQDGDVLTELGNADVDSGDGSWSYGLITEEAPLQARLVLAAGALPIDNVYVYDEIRTSLSANRDDLNFAPGPLSAGTVYNGVSVGSGYWYLFKTDSAGDYAFKLNSAGLGNVGVTLYNASRSSIEDEFGNTAVTLAQNLTAETAYYIKLDLPEGGYSRAFQFQVNPMKKANLTGTVDFSSILALGGVVSSVEVSVYDSGSHTQLVEQPVTVDMENGCSWSITDVTLDSPSLPAVFVVAVNLSDSNGIPLYFEEYRVITGDNNGLDFSLAALKGENPFTRITVAKKDYLLFVPAEAGVYSLKLNIGGGSVKLYIPEHESVTADIKGEIEIVQTLEAGKACLIEVSSNSDQLSETYQFRAVKLQSATLRGTVSLSRLAPLTAGDIHATYIRFYDAGGSALLDTPVPVGGNGSWKADIPFSGTPQTVRIEALVLLKNGGTIMAHREVTISGSESGLELAPAAQRPTDGLLVKTSGKDRDSFLLVPSASGYFNLEVISGSAEPPSVALYNAAGAKLSPVDGSSLYELTAGAPYIVVNNITNFAVYQFLMRQLSSLSIGGSVDYSKLPDSLPQISSATVSAYLTAPPYTQIFSGAAVTAAGDGFSWSASPDPSFAGKNVRLTLTIALNNDLSISSHIKTVLQASDALQQKDFAPAGVATGYEGSVAAGESDWLLWVPEEAGNYTLGVDPGSMNTSMNLYDGSTGAPIASNNALIVSTAGHPYLIQVKEAYNNAGSFTFTVIKN
jgi:hypothetical protein